MIQIDSEVDVVISGAGMAGNTLACVLANGGFRVAIIEPRPPSIWCSKNYSSIVSAINLASENILTAINVWQGIKRKRISPFYRIETWDTSSSGVVSFDASDAGLQHLGHIVENSVLTTALHEELNRFSKVDIYYGATIDHWTLDRDRVIVVSDTGQRIEARVLVGADGALSRVRDLAGISLTEHSYRHTAIVARVRTEKLHRHTARQSFLSTGPLASLPLADGSSIIVWSIDSSLTEELLECDEKAFCEQLVRAFSYKLGTVTLVSERLSFQLIKRRVNDYIAKRVALIGDAAHTVHPLAGLGGNQGIADAASLAEVIVKSAKNGADFGELQTLRHYERWRKSENTLQNGILDGIYNVFCVTNPTILRLRGIGMNVVNNTQVIKNIIIKRATGLSGDLPQIAKSLVS